MMDLMLSLHLPTLMITFTAISAVLGITMSVYWLRQRSLPGLGHWTLAIMMASAGIAMLVARMMVPLWVSVLFGNLLVFTSSVLILVGIRRFGGLTGGWVMPAWGIVIVMAILMYDVLTRDDIVFRALLCAVWLAIMYGLCATECWRMGRRVARRLWVLPSMVFMFLSLLQMGRTFGLLKHPAEMVVFVTSPAQATSFLVATVSVAAAAIAMMGLSNEWLQGRLKVEAAENARVARERDQAAQAAQAANAAKSMFLATVSHEIRNPVNAIMGGLELLRLERDPSGDRVLSVMDKAGHSLLALLEDLLDISRIEAGHLSLDPKPIDLHQHLRDAVDLMMARAEAAGLDLDLAIAPEVPRHVQADPARLRQTLLNLLGNAVKFTPRGGVRVIATCTGTEAATAAEGLAPVRIVVADTGIGIAAETLPHVFDAFYQAEAGEKRRFGGVGLGLAICRRLIEMMGGKISVESVPGQGTAFILDIPLPVAPAPKAAMPARRLPFWTRKPVILLVEDDAVNRFVATQLLTRQGLEVLVAADGPTALEMLTMHEVAAVLMDIGMPGMDGFETTDRLRRSAGPMAAVPVLALTANVLPDTVSRSRAVGMQGFVAKPIRLDELLTALARLVPPDDMRNHGVAAAADDPLALLRDLLGPAAVERLRAMATQEVAEARLRMTASGLTGRAASVILLRVADALDSLGLIADGQALRDCLPLLASDLPVSGNAQAAIDAILAAVQGRLRRSKLPLAGAA